MQFQEPTGTGVGEGRSDTAMKTAPGWTERGVPRSRSVAGGSDVVMVAATISIITVTAANTDTLLVPCQEVISEHHTIQLTL